MPKEEGPDNPINPGRSPGGNKSTSRRNFYPILGRTGDMPEDILKKLNLRFII